jgi:hypothetical protein
MRGLAGQGAILAATVAGLLWAEGAGAQAGRPWVDPPAQAETPAPQAPPPAQPPAAQPEAPAAPAQPRRVDTPPASEPRMPPGEPVPGPDQASPAPRAPTPAAPRTERAAPPSGTAPEGRPRQEEASPPRASPPVRSAEPPRSPPDTEPPGFGERRQRGSDHAAAAQDFAIAYLAFWSAPNVITLDATPDFYAPRVLFHGRQMSARALFEEKRRFVQRWPLRDYRPQPETMRAACDPAPPICTVRTLFAFTALSPRTGKRSQGTALLQLGISFATGEPMIVFESSQVTSRARSAKSEALEDAEDDRD